MSAKKKSQSPPWSPIQVLPWVLALGLGALGIWQFHNTEFLSSFNLVPGGRGDNRFVTSILEYLYQAYKGHGQFLSPAFYYPTPRCIGYSDLYVTHTFVYGWLRNLGLDIFTCYQVTVLTLNILTYLCGFWMLRWAFGFGVKASAFGSFLFAFNCPKFNQIDETQVQSLFWLALATGLVVLFIRKSKSLTKGQAFFFLSGAALSWDMQCLTGFYMAWFFFFWACFFLAASFLWKPTREHLMGLIKKFTLPVGGAVGVLFLGLIPFLWVYLPVLLDLGGKSYDEVRMSLPQFWSFLWMGPRHAWWGWLWDKCPAIRAFAIEEGQRLGYGLVVSATWIVLTFTAVQTLWRKQRKPLDPFISYGALAVLSTTLLCLLSLDYGGFSPWYLVFKVVPGGQSIRVVGRLVILLALPISIILAFVLNKTFEKAAIQKDLTHKFLLGLGALLLAGAGVWEQVNLPPYAAFDKRNELQRLEYLSQKLPWTAKVFYVAPAPSLPVIIPFSATNLQIDAMLLSAVRGIPTLNGYSGHSPKDNWGLFKVRSPKYEEYVQDWVNRHPLPGPAYRLEIDR